METQHYRLWASSPLLWPALQPSSYWCAETGSNTVNGPSKVHASTLQYMSTHWLTCPCQKRSSWITPTLSICMWLFALHEIDEEWLSSLFKNTENISKEFHETLPLSVVFFLNQLYIQYMNSLYALLEPWQQWLHHCRPFFALLPHTLKLELYFYLCTVVLLGLNRITQYGLFYLTSSTQCISRFTFIVTAISLALVFSTIPPYGCPEFIYSPWNGM